MLFQAGWSKTSWDAQRGWSFGESCARLRVAELSSALLEETLCLSTRRRGIILMVGQKRSFYFLLLLRNHHSLMRSRSRSAPDELESAVGGRGQDGETGGCWCRLCGHITSMGTAGCEVLCQCAELRGCQTPRLWEPCVCGRGCDSKPLCAAESLPPGFSVLIYVGLSRLSFLREMVIHIQEERGLLCTRYPKEPPVFKCHSL